jgi:hypothetical protein
MTLLIALPPESVLNQSGQLIGSAADGLVQGLCLVSDRNRLPAFEAGFHHAALVARAALMAVPVAQVDFYPRDVSAESTQRTLHFSIDFRDQSLMTSNVVVCIDLDLHYVLR